MKPSNCISVIFIFLVALIFQSLPKAVVWKYPAVMGGIF